MNGTHLTPVPGWWPPFRAWYQPTRKAWRNGRKQIVVFTEPDGTLLEHRTHPCVPACEALRFLADHEVPIVLCSSRTRGELELIQQEFKFRHPFVSENGGAAYLPRDYFSQSRARGEMPGYDVVAFGAPHQQVVERLRRTANALAIDIRNFNGMSVQEVADECGVSLGEARLAQLREYGEPFRILASDPAVHSRLLNALRRAGLRCVSGGRFHHVSLGADMRRSVRTVTALYGERFGAVLTVGVSSGLVDLSLLSEVDIPIVVMNAEVDFARLLRKVPAASVTSATGSLGWDEAIFSAVEPALQKSPHGEQR